jgi:hypothetical protein
MRGLPTGFDYAGNLALQGPRSKANSAHAKLPQECPRTPANITAVILPYGKLLLPFSFGDQRFFSH